ncbi:unnamed protein product, partial [Iphiclides podalirius]
MGNAHTVAGDCFGGSPVQRQYGPPPNVLPPPSSGHPSPYPPVGPPPLVPSPDAGFPYQNAPSQYAQAVQGGQTYGQAPQSPQGAWPQGNLDYTTNQGSAPSEYPQVYSQRGYAQQWYRQPEYPPQDYYPQGYPQQGYPQQGYPQQGYLGHGQANSIANTAFCASCIACLTCLLCSCCQGLLGAPGDPDVGDDFGATPGGGPEVAPPTIGSSPN